MYKKILIIGGAGYIGTELSNYLVKKKYKVSCVDTFWFDTKLDKKVKKIKLDVRNFSFSIFENYDVVINLAYLSNDPLCEINARDTWESGPLATYYMMEACIKYKVKKFIFASSGSIYGLKKEKKVTEELGLDPITDYNKSKMICEKVIENYKNRIKIVILRPATVCGYSPRMRFDVSVNNLTIQALQNKKINVFGGKQIRPNVNIADISRIFQHFIFKGKKIKSGFGDNLR